MAPVGSADARVIILGSLPGERSLAAQRYYAHPTNQFWRLLGSAIGEELHGLDYDERLALLAASDIALWDVVAEAARVGSLDGSIRSASTNALAAYVGSHPRLEAIAFNGKTASRIGRRALAGFRMLDLIDLPSSSAALTWPFAEKAAAWSAIARYAGVARAKEKDKLTG